MRLAEIVIEAAAGRAPVVVGVSDTSARNVVALARHAEASGADLVMVWPPYYGVRTRAGVLAFYEYVAARIGIGMVVYSTTLSELGFYLTPDMADELAAIDHVCAVQNTTASFMRVCRDDRKGRRPPRHDDVARGILPLRQVDIRRRSRARFPHRLIAAGPGTDKCETALLASSSRPCAAGISPAPPDMPA